MVYHERFVAKTDLGARCVVRIRRSKDVTAVKFIVNVLPSLCVRQLRVGATFKRESRLLHFFASQGRRGHAVDAIRHFIHLFLELRRANGHFPVALVLTENSCTSTVCLTDKHIGKVRIASIKDVAIVGSASKRR